MLLCCPSERNAVALLVPCMLPPKVTIWEVACNCSSRPTRHSGGDPLIDLSDDGADRRKRCAIPHLARTHMLLSYDT